VSEIPLKVISSVVRAVDAKWRKSGGCIEIENRVQCSSVSRVTSRFLGQKRENSGPAFAGLPYIVIFL
jgi:hypothetical protein